MTTPTPYNPKDHAPESRDPLREPFADPLVESMLGEALAAPGIETPDMQAISQHVLAGTTPLLPSAARQTMDDVLSQALDTSDASSLALDNAASMANAPLADAILNKTAAAIQARAESADHSQWPDRHLHSLLDEALAAASAPASNISAAQDLAARITAATAASLASPSQKQPAVIATIGKRSAFSTPRLAMAAGIGLLLISLGVFAVLSNPSGPGTGAGTGPIASGNHQSTNLQTASTEATVNDLAQSFAAIPPDDSYATASSLSAQLALIETTPLWSTPQDTLETALTLSALDESAEDTWTVF